MTAATTHPVPTTSHQVEAEDAQTGEKTTITIQVPRGTLDEMLAREPKGLVKEIAVAMFKEENWKDATAPFHTTDLALAQEVGRVFDWFLGGHEWNQVGPVYVVSSLGYYHYTGA